MEALTTISSKYQIMIPREKKRTRSADFFVPLVHIY